MSAIGRFIPPLTATLLCAACAQPPVKPEPVTIDVPVSWRNQPEGVAGQALIGPEWWRHFGSDELTQLIERARGGSFDIAVAITNVQQARLRAQLVDAEVAPSINSSASVSGDGKTGTHLDASYEVDFWGRNQALRAGALASLRATEFDQATVALTITSSVASAYVQILWLRQQEQMAWRNLELARKVMRVVSSRHRAGAATRLDVSQQEGVIVNLRASILSLRRRERDSIATLAALLGLPPQELRLVARDLQALRVPSIDSGLPAQLLTRRPDIASIEQRLRAADANIEVARSAMFPSFALGATVSGQSDDLRQLIESPAESLVASLVAPIFDAGRRSTSHELAMAQRQALLGAYQANIVAALADVEIMLNAHNSIERQLMYQDEAEQLARESFTLAESRYRAGAADSLALLDAQRTLYATSEARLALHRDQLQAAIGLFKALGGGWSAERS